MGEPSNSSGASSSDFAVAMPGPDVDSSSGKPEPEDPAQLLEQCWQPCKRVWLWVKRGYYLTNAGTMSAMECQETWADLWASAEPCNRYPKGDDILATDEHCEIKVFMPTTYTVRNHPGGEIWSTRS